MMILKGMQFTVLIYIACMVIVMWAIHNGDDDEN